MIPSQVRMQTMYVMNIQVCLALNQEGQDCCVAMFYVMIIISEILAATKEKNSTH